MEISDVLAQKMMDLRFWIFPLVIKGLVVFVTPLLRRSDVSDRRVKPDVPIISRAVRNFKTKIGRRARNVPIAKFLATFTAFGISEKMPQQVVANFGLQMVLVLHVSFKEVMQFLELNEEVRGRPNLRRRIRQLADRVNQVSRRIGGSALAAVVSRLIRRLAIRTGPSNKPVRQESPLLRVIQLLHVAGDDQSSFTDRDPDFITEFLILRRMRAAIVIEFNLKSGKVFLMRLTRVRDDFLFRAPFFPRPNHDCGAVGVVRTNKQTSMPPQLLKPNPDISLSVFDQVPKMDWAIRVGQRGSHQYFSFFHYFFRMPDRPRKRDDFTDVG